MSLSIQERYSEVKEELDGKNPFVKYAFLREELDNKDPLKRYARIKEELDSIKEENAQKFEEDKEKRKKILLRLWNLFFIHLVEKNRMLKINQLLSMNNHKNLYPKKKL